MGVYVGARGGAIGVVVGGKPRAGLNTCRVWRLWRQTARPRKARDTGKAALLRNINYVIDLL